MLCPRTPVLLVALACVFCLATAVPSWAAKATCEVSARSLYKDDNTDRSFWPQYRTTVRVSYELRGFAPSSVVYWSCRLVTGPSGGSGWDFTPLAERTDSRGYLEKSEEHSSFGYYVYTFKDAAGHKVNVPMDFNGVRSNGDGAERLNKLAHEGDYNDAGELVADAAGGPTAHEGTPTATPQANPVAQVCPWPTAWQGTWTLLGGPTVTFGPGTQFSLNEGRGPVTLTFRGRNGNQYLTGDGDRTCRFEVEQKGDSMILMTFVVQPFNLRRSFFGIRQVLSR